MKGLVLAAFAGAVAFAGASHAATPIVFFDQGTYDVQACPTPTTPGEAQCFARVVTDATGGILQNRNQLGSPLAKAVNGSQGAPQATPLTTPSGYGPSDLRSAYAITGMGSSTTTVAVVDAYGYPDAESDLGVYRAQYGLPPCTTANGCFTKLNESGVQGSYPVTNIGWDQESALDLDMVSAMCPNCKILLIEGNTQGVSDLAHSANLAATLGAHVVSNSYGYPEQGTQSFESYYNHPGVAITASSGDGGYGVIFPSSSQHVTAVGGTALRRSSTMRGWTETAWSGAGSGCSAFYPKPAWQKDPLCSRRTVSDVSAVASPATGVAVYGPNNNGQPVWEVFGGTSVSAPLVGGIYGLNAGPVDYGANPYANVSLYDVVSGSNGSCGGTYLCTAVPGYDGPTGLGTPRGDTAF